MFSGLTVFGDTGFKFSLGGGNHEDGNISLRSSGDHVFDEISMAWGINDSKMIFGGFEFPEGNINGDTSFSFGFKFV